MSNSSAIELSAANLQKNQELYREYMALGRGNEEGETPQRTKDLMASRIAYHKTLHETNAEKHKRWENALRAEINDKKHGGKRTSRKRTSRKRTSRKRTSRKRTN